MNIAEIAQEGIERLERPGKVVYVASGQPDRTLDGADLHSRGVRFGTALRELGIAPGDRVAVMIPNEPVITSIYHGINRMGGVVLPILFLLAPNEVRHILSDSGAKAILTSPEFLDTVRKAADGLPDLEHIIVIRGEGAEGTVDFEEIVDAAPGEIPIVDRADEDLALLIYTGGTTGRPKGVMLTHRNLTFAADAAAKVTLESMREQGLEPGATGISALPLAHSFGVIVSLVGPKVQRLAGTTVGGTSVLMQWFDPEHFLRCIAEYGCRTTALVPTMMTYLLDHPAADRYDTSSLTSVTSSAAPLPLETLRAFEEKFGCTVFESWGLTEAAPLGTSNRAAKRKVGSVGVPFPGIEIQIQNPETGEPVPAGENGEICLRGPNVMKGYWNLPEETEEALAGGWLHTGDLGHLDPDGYLYVVDRVKNMIIRGGLNIYPRDIEELLHEHPAVLEAAAVGVPDPQYGEEVEAFVVLKGDAAATHQELLDYCREHLAKYKTPKAVHFIDQLPKSGVGKILHRQLRDEAVGRKEAAGKTSS